MDTPIISHRRGRELDFQVEVSGNELGLMAQTLSFEARRTDRRGFLRELAIGGVGLVLAACAQGTPEPPPTIVSAVEKKTGGEEPEEANKVPQEVAPTQEVEKGPRFVAPASVVEYAGTTPLVLEVGGCVEQSRLIEEDAEAQQWLVAAQGLLETSHPGVSGWRTAGMVFQGKGKAGVLGMLQNPRNRAEGLVVLSEVVNEAREGKLALGGTDRVAALPLTVADNQQEVVWGVASAPVAELEGAVLHSQLLRFFKQDGTLVSQLPTATGMETGHIWFGIQTDNDLKLRTTYVQDVLPTVPTQFLGGAPSRYLVSKEATPVVKPTVGGFVVDGGELKTWKEGNWTTAPIETKLPIKRVAEIYGGRIVLEAESGLRMKQWQMTEWAPYVPAWGQYGANEPWGREGLQVIRERNLTGIEVPPLVDKNGLSVPYGAPIYQEGWMTYVALEGLDYFDPQELFSTRDVNRVRILLARVTHASGDQQFVQLYLERNTSTTSRRWSLSEFDYEKRYSARYGDDVFGQGANCSETELWDYFASFRGNPRGFIAGIQGEDELLRLLSGQTPANVTFDPAGKNEGYYAGSFVF